MLELNNMVQTGPVFDDDDNDDDNMSLNSNAVVQAVTVICSFSISLNCFNQQHTPFK